MIIGYREVRSFRPGASEITLTQRRRETNCWGGGGRGRLLSDIIQRVVEVVKQGEVVPFDLGDHIKKLYHVLYT